jgi:hypothetical protein
MSLLLLCKTMALHNARRIPQMDYLCPFSSRRPSAKLYEKRYENRLPEKSGAPDANLCPRR